MKNRQYAPLFILLSIFTLQGCQTLNRQLGSETVDGKQLYATNCAACHGAYGRGGVGVPLALNDFLKNSSDEFLAMSIRVGRPGRVMPSFWSLTEQEIQAIVGVIRSWGPKSPPFIDREVVGDPVKGEVLFNKNCASCHGNDAVGGAGTGAFFSRDRFTMIVPPALNNAGFLLSATDEMIKHTITFGRAGTPMKSFRRKGLKRGDVNNLVAYIRSFQSRLPPISSVVDEVPSVVLSAESPYSMDETAERIENALERRQWLTLNESVTDQLSPEKKSSDLTVKTLYFSHTKESHEMLSLDPRVRIFQPNRFILMQPKGAAVTVMISNPAQFSALFNNSSLNASGRKMSEQYQQLLMEVVQ